MTAISEANVERAALDWLHGLSWQVGRRSDIPPDSPNSECTDYGQVV